MEAGGPEIRLAEKTTYSIVPFLGSGLKEEHRNLVLVKWMRTLRFGNDLFRLIDSNAYFASYQEYIKTLLKRPECIVRMAVLTDAPDVCLGFSVSEPDVLHYVWSNKDNRGIGIARSLVPFSFSVFTHLTNAGMLIWNKKYPNARFNPFR